MKVCNLLLIVAFLALITTPLVGYWLDRRGDFSPTENRLLVPKPAWPRSLPELNALPKSLESAFNDRFGLRETLVRIQRRTKLALGDSPVDSVVIGKDGWLFLSGPKYFDPIGDLRGVNRLDQRQLDCWAITLQNRKEWLASRGIPYIFMIAPNKSSIYPEYIPDRFTRFSNETPADQLQSYLAKVTSVKTVDAKAVLLRQKAKGQWLYLKKDTHWNHLGAYLVYQQLERVLAQMLCGSIKPAPFTPADFQWSTRVGGDLANMIGIAKTASEDSPTLQHACSAHFSGDIGRYAGGTIISRNAGKTGTALVFRDSFFTALQPFVAEAFGTVVFVWKRPSMGDLQQLISQYHPDIVIEEIIERSLKVAPPVTPAERNAFKAARIRPNKSVAVK